MKALSAVLLLMASMALVLMGCSDSLSPAVSPTTQAFSSLTASTGLPKAGVEVIHSLRGSANAYYTLWYGPDGSVWGTIPGLKQKGRFYNVETIQADAYSGGTVTGSLLYQFLGQLPPGVEAFGFLGRVEGKVIKLAVEDTKAFVVVEVTKVNGFPPGAWFAQVFIDNGEGASSSDEVSEWFVTDAPTVDPGYGSRDLWLSMGPDEFITWCTAQLQGTGVPVVFPIDHGNIQVR